MPFSTASTPIVTPTVRIIMISKAIAAKVVLLNDLFTFLDRRVHITVNCIMASACVQQAIAWPSLWSLI